MLNPFRWLVRIALLSVLAVLLGIFFLRHCSAEYKKELPKNALAILKAEADSCKATHDVPVAAAIWYKDSLLASAHNDVVGGAQAGGHAEINVLSKCLRTIGYQKFMDLNRDELLLISTYEPCRMCSGAITEYNIRKVIFIGKKEALYRMRREDWPLIRYWKDKKHYESELQDKMFREMKN